MGPPILRPLCVYTLIRFPRAGGQLWQGGHGTLWAARLHVPYLRACPGPRCAHAAPPALPAVLQEYVKIVHLVGTTGSQLALLGALDVNVGKLIIELTVAKMAE